MTIVDGSVVEINYNLTNNLNEQLDSTNGQKPLSYIQGKNNVIPGLEKALMGKKVGDQVKATINPEEGYGHINEELIFSVPKAQFGDDVANLKLGMQFEIGVGKDQVLIATVVEIKENEVVLDGNHPLAGEVLNFDVEVVSIRKATEEELKKGHLAIESDCCNDPDCSN